MENLHILSFIFMPEALSGHVSRICVSAFRRTVPFCCLSLLQDLSLTACQKLKLPLSINVAFQGRLCSWHYPGLQFVPTRGIVYFSLSHTIVMYHCSLCFITPQSVPSDLEKN